MAEQARLTGDYEGSLQFCEELIKSYDKIDGEEHRYVFWAIKSKADIHAAREAWPEARKELLRILDQKVLLEDADLALMGLAALDVHLGEIASYEAHRKLMLDRFATSQSPRIANRIAKVCLLVPVHGEELNAAVALADRGVKLEENAPGFYRDLAAHSLARYRAGDWPGAAASAERSLALAGDDGKAAGKGLATLMEAMAFEKLNRSAEARAALDRAVEIVDQSGKANENWHDVLIANILLREARGQIQP